MPRCLPIALLLLAACETGATELRVRPVAWAQPVLAGGVENWYRVDDELYRCAQPSADGMRELVALGVRTVVNLRGYHSDADEIAGTGLLLVEPKLCAGDLDYAQLVQTLRAMLAAEKPLAVHCWRGADRTGAVVAAWRVAVDGWTPAAALDEMTAGGFGHACWYDNLRALVAGLDRERLRRDVGLPVGP